MSKVQGGELELSKKKKATKSKPCKVADNKKKERRRCACSQNQKSES